MYAWINNDWDACCRWWGYVGAAFTAGYTLGQLLNEHTDIQKFIAENIGTVVNALNTGTLVNAQSGEDGDGQW